jgi:hypothetical protein
VAGGVESSKIGKKNEMKNSNFLKINFYLFFKKNFEIFADWLKNKVA